MLVDLIAYSSWMSTFLLLANIIPFPPLFAYYALDPVSTLPHDLIPFSLFFFCSLFHFLLSQNACLVLKVLKIPSIFYFDFVWVFLELEGTWYYLSTMGKLLKFYIGSVAKGVIVWVRDHHWWIGALGSWVFVCYMVLRVCFGLVCVC